MKYLTKKDNRLFTKQEFRNRIMELQEKIAEMPASAKCGTEKFKNMFPLAHFHLPGMYMRSMYAPAGALIVTKIHKIDHPYFIMSGDCSILTEKGIVRRKAPYYGITLAGTKRVVFVHKDTEWMTIHATQETDLVKIEEDTICKDFEEFDRFERERLSIRERYLLKELEYV